MLMLVEFRRLNVLREHFFVDLNKLNHRPKGYKVSLLGIGGHMQRLYLLDCRVSPDTPVSRDTSNDVSVRPSVSRRD